MNIGDNVQKFRFEPVETDEPVEDNPNQDQSDVETGAPKEDELASAA